MIAVGAQNILFNVEKPGSYRIVCEDVNEQMSLTVDPYRPDIKDLALVVPTTAQKAAAKKVTLNGFTVKAQKSRIVAVSWTKKATVSGYEIQYSMKKNFKQARIATINRSGINRCAINNLKKKKKYFFRARTFTIVKNKATGRTEKVYGKWTTAKKIKVKK